MARMKLRIPKSVDSLSDNSLIGGLMVVVTLVVSISFIVSKFWIGDIKFNNKVISAKNQANNTLANNVAQLQALQANFGNMETNGVTPNQVLQALPLTVAYGDFGKEIEAMAALGGVELSTVTQADTEDEDTSTTTVLNGPQTVNFQVSVVGSYPNLEKFLANIEASKRPIIIDTASFGGSGSAVNLDLTLTTFFQAASTVNNQTETLTE